ncbi:MULTISPECIES: NAD-dependent protein deacetylase [Metallosphaera]|uniref:NAD-dependent protein deacetylase n=3 Tax=Metallosphaera TaxID=41980 RepID=A4YFQ8_METS5|nr:MULTISPECIES: NAD-dependent protein deacetylase [Metallosphaera]ABP95260.1 Silent information regulator protein Sir2 [Metallosphaera sedula DSM 5348]AIM27246.1 Silent information regulator protein Sir2 [Metallosphaera sedula]AKV74135.1 NAD-dependent deacetylase [Metallosphaera sedula]AKV76375.1 NAD-dependent deacetylase [Metallosphaera sedula]AKV78626.1 NAD-dependent deacetylase [Metallosphaera sedula]
MDLAELLLTSTHGIAFTGAGISTASGIPDFRGPQGLWKKYPQELSSASYLRRDPKGFWEFYAFRLKAMDSVAPNPAHYALAELERMGLIKYVITQNIDGLHQDAGSRNVIELHGTSRRFYCEDCGMNFERKEVLGKVQDGELPPRCRCGGVIRPGVVLFDEPVHLIHEALRIAQESDLVLVVGSSLTVYPANLIPQVVKQNGGVLVIINMEETPLDEFADLVIRERAEEVLPRTVKKIKELVGNG